MTLIPRPITQVAPAPVPIVPRKSGRWPVLVLGGGLLLFAHPLFELVRFAYHSDLYSYILLIPVVSLYVARATRQDGVPDESPNRLLAASLLTLGVGGLAACMSLRLELASLPIQDRLAITTPTFVLALAGACAWFAPRTTFRRLIFPLGFLVFMMPIPATLMPKIELFMQHGSAMVAKALFDIAGTVAFYHDLTFQLPGIHLHVAPECSGIRSTLVLLIVSVVTGKFFLRSPAHRAFLAAAIVPLALLRNGLRIFVIGELCVRYGPEMIHSFIHRRGGPIFFALSLVPLLLLVLLLQRREVRAARIVTPSR